MKVRKWHCISEASMRVSGFARVSSPMKTPGAEASTTAPPGNSSRVARSIVSYVNGRSAGWPCQVRLPSKVCSCAIDPPSMRKCRRFGGGHCRMRPGASRARACPAPAHAGDGAVRAGASVATEPAGRWLLLVLLLVQRLRHLQVLAQFRERFVDEGLDLGILRLLARFLEHLDGRFMRGDADAIDVHRVERAAGQGLEGRDLGLL